MSDTIQSFSTHFEELRKALLRALLCLSLGVALCAPFSASLFSLFTNTFPLSSLEKSTTISIENPSNRTAVYTLSKDEALVQKDSSVLQRATSFSLPPGGKIAIQKKQKPLQLIALSPLDGISVLLKVSILSGALLTFPFWTGALLQFILPALQQAEKLFVTSFFLLSFVFLGLGLLFGYFVLIPICQVTLESINQQIATNQWALLPYLDFCLMLLFASCLSFQAWIATLLLVRVGILSYEKLKSARKAVILTSFILGALFTPPDVLSQVSVALPLVAMYELSLLFARFIR